MTAVPTLTPNDIAVWAVVPAAGLSRRMGRPKQTLPYQGTTMVAAVVQSLLDAGVNGVVGVTRTEFADRLALPADPRVIITINDRADSEMIDSIRAGLEVLSRGIGHLRAPIARDGVLVLPGDMPHVSVQTCRLCIEAYRTAPLTIVVAAHQQVRGHPLIFPFALHGEVEQLHGGLRTLLDNHADIVEPVETGSNSVLQDIDSPEDLESASR